MSIALEDVTQHEVRIDSIQVSGRHRSDFGNVGALANSIDTVGLIHPIVVTPDHLLVAGERRLAAVRSLGWESVAVTVIHTLADATDLLTAERDENTCRKDMTVSEKALLGAALETLEQPKADKRRGGDRRSPVSSGPTVPLDQDDPEPKRVRDTVGSALGMSGRTYERVKDLHKTATGQTADPTPIVEVAKELLARADRGELAPRAAHERLRDARDGKPPPLTETGAKRTNRRAITDRVAEVATQILRATEGLAKCASDERFPKNRNQIRIDNIAELKAANNHLSKFIATLEDSQ